jgi:type II secretory pathway pseudopilin PulG
LVVIAIIGILVALLLPAIQAAREAARRTQCLDHQKNLSLALQTYHDVYKTFPAGVMVAGGGRNTARAPALGPSWYFGIMPFIEQKNIYDKISDRQRNGVGPDEFCAGKLNPNINNALRDLVPEFLICPSTPLPRMETQDGPVCLASYVGISGGCDISNGSSDYGSGPANGTPNPSRTYVNQRKAVGPSSSIVTASGMLPPAQNINMAGCSDGTSNTMIIGNSPTGCGIRPVPSRPNTTAIRAGMKPVAPIPLELALRYSPTTWVVGFPVPQQLGFKCLPQRASPPRTAQLVHLRLATTAS